MGQCGAETLEEERVASQATWLASGFQCRTPSYLAERRASALS